MKYTITHVAEWVLLAIIGILFCYTAYKSYQIKEKVEYITTTDTIKICDTISNWVPYDVHHYRTDTAYLPIIKEKFDTILKIDSVLVQVPIHIYKFDSVIQDSTHTSRIQAVVSGFSVSLDTLSIQTEIYPQKAKKEPWYSHIVPAAGIGYGSGGVGVFVGVGLKIF